MRTNLDLFPIDGADLQKVSWLHGTAPSKADLDRLLNRQSRSIDRELFEEWIRDCVEAHKDDVSALIEVLEELKVTAKKNGVKKIVSSRLKHMMTSSVEGLTPEEYMNVASQFDKNGLIDAEEFMHL